MEPLSLFDMIVPFGNQQARDNIQYVMSHPNRHPKSLARGMLVDLKEGGENFEIKADIPGVKKENIKVDMHDDMVTISVSQETETEEGQEGDKKHCIERSSMFEKRSMRLPRSADLGHAKAAYENGVLSLNIPKKPEESYKSKTITIE